MINKFEVCQRCGVVFDADMQIFNGKGMRGDNILICPVCKSEYEIPKKYSVKDYEEMSFNDHLMDKDRY